MNKIDLHTHTTCSDGTLTPKELIEKAAEIGLEAIAVTDHDITNGIDEAIETAKAFPGLSVIPGIELSSGYKNREVHIVGLFIDRYNKGFNETLNELREKRQKRNISMINKLKSLGLDVSYDELLSVSGKNIITRAHFAVLLEKKGYVQTKDEAFAKYIGQGKPGYVKRDILTASDAIALIRAAGGLPIIAHPFSYGFGTEQVEDMVSDFAFYGAVGMECYYSTHSYEDTVFALSLCESYGLLPSGGSDFHGKNKPGLELGSGYGDLEVPKKILEDLKVKKYGRQIYKNNCTE